MTILAVPLDQLQVSELNVRTNEEDANATAALEASIASVGLLEPLIAHRIEHKLSKKDHYGIFAGGRRLRALKALAARGIIEPAAPIDIVVRDLSDAQITEASIAENMLRRNLRAYELYRAYAKAQERGLSIDDLAEHFGQRRLVVEQTLRLGHLHPVIFSALEIARITDDQARAYAATEDHQLQLDVFARFKDAPPNQHAPRDIRAALRVADQDAERMLLFVGRRAYEAAGGAYERDLFQEADHDIGRVVHPEILAGLVAARLEQLRGRITAAVPRPFKFAEKPPQMGGAHGYDDRELKLEIRRAPLSAEEQARREQLVMDIDRLSAERASIDAQDLTDDARAEQREEITALIDEAETAIELLDGGRRYQLPRKGDLVAVLKVGADGSPDLTFWFASRKARKDADAKQSAAPAISEGVAMNDTASPGQAQVANRRVADEHGLTKDGIEIFRGLRRMLLRAFLIEDGRAEGNVAVDYVIWSQLRAKIYDGFRDEVGAWPITPNWQENADVIAEPYLADQPGKALWDETVERLKAQTFITSKNLGAAFIDFQHAAPELKRDAAAIVAGLSLQRSINADGYRLDIHDVLANQTKRSEAKSIRRLWTPTPPFLDLMPKGKRSDIVEGMVDGPTFAAWAKMKSTEITEKVAKVLIGRSPSLREGGLAKAASWVHPVLQFGRPKVSDVTSADKQEAA